MADASGWVGGVPAFQGGPKACDRRDEYILRRGFDSIAAHGGSIPSELSAGADKCPIREDVPPPKTASQQNRPPEFTSGLSKICKWDRKMQDVKRSN